MEIRTSQSLVEYPVAVSVMEERVAAIKQGEKDDLLWLLEHPPLYTAGTSAKAEDLLDARFPVYETGRGGEHTYHGPGQRVGYVMVDLKKRQQSPDIKKYVHDLEEAVIRSLAHFGVNGSRRAGRVGIWVEHDNTESKIAAIGVRIRHWVTFHGVSVNLNPDLSHFGGIVPCGISNFGVTSLHELGKKITMEELDRAMVTEFKAVFAS
ncbi:MAG: lipoate-protein ligase B [Micavibrio aeruginosavorus]|uniref:Octanoyltransferase n=1 Tax=Micavibrio aeruginosavorus TaxID=349221 RepID=A0A2W5N0S5_9BACT|nr:MAG: lipoate-protein ligase B [Micavibrio aeruginosavorus]